jgi:hypothetical protein
MVRSVVSAFGLWFGEGDYNYAPNKTLNDVFPEIKALKVKDMVNQAWKRS